MPQQQNLAIPIAIVLAGALIAGALYLGAGGSISKTPGTTTGGDTTTHQNIPAVTSSDHIRGNPDAPIKIVQYTDLECPFCKQFDGTMKAIMTEYGSTGEVAWVLRNFPLQQLHPNAPALAEAAECVADLGGNDAYWKFSDSIIAQAPINTFFDMSKLDQTVSGVGVNVTAFETCYKSGKFRDKISKEFNDAVASGGEGTPHNIVITKDGEQIALPGSQPLDKVKGVIDHYLALYQ